METAYAPTIRKVDGKVVIKVTDDLEVALTPYMWERLVMQYECERMWDETGDGGNEYETI